MRKLSYILCVALSIFFITHSIEAKYDVRALEKRVEILFEQLKSKNSVVRYKAAVELTKIQHRKAVKPLIFALGDSSSFVRLTAAKGLGGLKYFEAVNPLIRRLKIEKELFVQVELIRALGAIGDERARWILKDFAQGSNLTLKREAQIALKKLTKGANIY